MEKKKSIGKKIKKTLEITLLVIIISWITIFLIDYYRYSKELSPLIIIKTITKENDNTIITEELSLGYKFITYQTNNSVKYELKPLWQAAKKPESESKYPSLKDTSNAPENPEKLDKIDSFLYFYDHNSELIYTYQCLTDTCNITKSATTKENFAYSNLPMAPYNNYVFITEESDGNPLTYIIDIKENKIKYSIEGLIIASSKNSQSKAEGNKGRYIITNQANKYALLDLSNEPTLLIAHNYEHIKYNPQSDTYITYSKYWVVTDLKENLYVSSNELSNAYKIGDDYYFERIKKETINDTVQTHYILLDKDHTPVFPEDYLLLDVINDKIITVNDLLLLSIKSLDNTPLFTDVILLKINPTTSDKTPYSFTIKDTEIILHIYYPDSTNEDRYYFNPQTFTLIKKEINQPT